MKKQYARPELSVYEMNLHQTILCGSITDSHGDAIGVDHITDSNGDAIGVHYYWDKEDDESEAL